MTVGTEANSVFEPLQNQAKLGFSVSIEAVSEGLQELQEQAAAAGAGPSTPSVPF